MAVDWKRKTCHCSSDCESVWVPAFSSTWTNGWALGWATSSLHGLQCESLHTVVVCFCLDHNSGNCEAIWVKKWPEGPVNDLQPPGSFPLSIVTHTNAHVTHSYNENLIKTNWLRAVAIGNVCIVFHFEMYQILSVLTGVKYFIWTEINQVLSGLETSGRQVIVSQQCVFYVCVWLEESPAQHSELTNSK